MAKLYPDITAELQAFIAQQPLFFVASAPLAADGHVNLSPKGLDCLRVRSPQQVAYLDLTGSGNETSAHVLENGRITLMFCAFTGAPRILRLYGRGRVIVPTMEAWAAESMQFPVYPGMRQIVVVEVERVQTSCGFGVPLMDLVGQRDTALRWAEAKGEQGLVDYRAEKNMVSIDSLPTHLASEAD
ncbi:pyridoxamine 5'-phosphate oxidase family protein [Herpetosiphon geysericola]|uniref:Pyridoxamine 5'-phosphate oxidase n=1 Tax=Herpetosiphon geysericola TaxID=70996 RepID=A0A0P6Y2U5_9CHLR|nr:pyridoxamine 5'-phosphate oxidase family protein [Herpetosiphon geysericola]KPL86188.1 pyridoxamine 5'-phosphate oxidase [Herpetosiphon geysericola]